MKILSYSTVLLKPRHPGLLWVLRYVSRNHRLDVLCHCGEETPDNTFTRTGRLVTSLEEVSDTSDSYRYLGGSRFGTYTIHPFDSGPLHVPQNVSV